MIDIEKLNDGEDLTVRSTIKPKAANVLSVQLGELEYKQDFGCDYKYFLQSDLQFQNESFKAYLVDRLTQHQVNTSKIIDLLEPLLKKSTFTVGDGSAYIEGLVL